MIFARPVDQSTTASRVLGAWRADEVYKVAVVVRVSSLTKRASGKSALKVPMLGKGLLSLRFLEAVRWNHRLDLIHLASNPKLPNIGTV
jgi:hypothetical protein